MFKLDADNCKKIAFVLASVGLMMPFLTLGLGSFWQKEYFEKVGVIGDWFGGTTAPLIGLAGFIMIVAAYLAQQEELKLTRESLDAQREELELTREEMKLTRLEFEEQNATLARQRFENTFFQLLSLHHTIVKEIQYQGKKVYRGREYFYHAYTAYNQLYSYEADDMGIVSSEPFNPQTDVDCLVKAYKEFYSDHQDNVGHYFRNLYHIVKLINNTVGLSEPEKRNYVSIVRAQLSTYEMVMLFYNATVGHGYWKFRQLIIDYEFLQNMNKDIIGKHYGYLREESLLKTAHEKYKTHD